MAAFRSQALRERSSGRELRFFRDFVNEQVDRIRRVVSALRRRHVRYALVGGHAVSYHWYLAGRGAEPLAPAHVRAVEECGKEGEVVRAVRVAVGRGTQPRTDDRSDGPRPLAHCVSFALVVGLRPVPTWL